MSKKHKKKDWVEVEAVKKASRIYKKNKESHKEKKEEYELLSNLAKSKFIERLHLVGLNFCELTLDDFKTRSKVYILTIPVDYPYRGVTYAVLGGKGIAKIETACCGPYKLPNLSNSNGKSSNEFRILHEDEVKKWMVREALSLMKETIIPIMEGFCLPPHKL